MNKRMAKNAVGAFGAMEVAYSKGKGLLADARAIIEAARGAAYRAVNMALVQRNWLLGKRIAEEELEGKRAEYGRKVIGELAVTLTEEYGEGFSAPALYQFAEFYRAFPILDSLRIKSGDILSWTHYRTLLQVKNGEARDWYKEEAGAETWSVRTLQRNISFSKVENFDLRHWGGNEARRAKTRAFFGAKGLIFVAGADGGMVSKVENFDLRRRLRRRVA